MYRDENKRLLISISADSYMSKDESREAVGTTMRWSTQDITMGEMLDYCVSGQTYCNLFHDENGELLTRPFNAKEKENNHFFGSDIITVDVDDVGSMADKYEHQLPNFIAELSSNNLEPSLWFTSYSHNPSEGILKAHLIYAFDSTIQGKDGGATYKTVASKLQERITETTGVPIDSCSCKCAQFINGTNIHNPDLSVEHGISYTVYEFSDFGFNNISALWEENIKGYKPKCKPATVSKWLITSLKEAGFDGFLNYYGNKFWYFWRKEEGYTWHQTSTGYWYAYIDDRYFSLYYNVNKVLDGQGRRKKVFERMCERRLMHPNATPNQIAFCAVKDIHLFFDNYDRVFDYEYIQRNVNNCFSLSLDEIEKKYSHNIAKRKAKAPKSGVIFKYNRGMTQGDKAKERKRLAIENVFTVYDITLSPAENVTYLKNEHNISISLSTLYSYFKECEIDYKAYKVIKQEKKIHDIQLCLVEMENSNTNITVRTLKEHLKQKGIKANTNDCCTAVKAFNIS